MATIDDCITKAQDYINSSNKSMCLLMFRCRNLQGDVDFFEVTKYLHGFMADINRQCSEYLPEHTLVSSRPEKGFELLDKFASWSAINTADIIQPIAEFQKKYYGDVQLEWDVARNCKELFEYLRS